MMKVSKSIAFGSALAIMFVLTALGQDYDVVIRNGTIYDGSGSSGFRGDVAIQGDHITAVGMLSDARGVVV